MPETAYKKMLNPCSSPILLIYYYALDPNFKCDQCGNNADNFEIFRSINHILSTQIAVELVDLLRLIGFGSV